MESLSEQIFSTLLALAFVGVLAWVTLSLLKRIQERRLGGALGKAVAEKTKLTFVRAMPVGAKERVVVVQYRGEEWLLGVSPGGISLLGRVSLTPPVVEHVSGDAASST